MDGVSPAVFPSSAACVLLAASVRTAGIALLSVSLLPKQVTLFLRNVACFSEVLGRLPSEVFFLNGVLHIDTRSW